MRLRPVAFRVARLGRRRPEQRREHRPPGRRVGGHAVHHGPREQALGRRCLGEQAGRLARRAGRPGCARRPRPVRRDGRPRSASGGLAQRRERDLRQGRQPVDGLWGSSIRSASRTSAPIASSAPAGAGSPPRASATGRRRERQTRAEVGDVLPLVLDRLGGGGERVEPGEGAVHEVGDDGRHRRQRTSGRARSGPWPVAAAAATCLEASVAARPRGSGFSSDRQPCASQRVE